MAALLLILAAAGLLREHLTGQGLFLGNYDRLGYFLASRLSELDSLHQNGAVSGWDDRMFMGFNSAGLPGATSPFSPMRLVTAFSSRADFYYHAGLCVAGLMALAGLSAYLCLRKLRLPPLPAFAGALVYMCCTHSMIRLAQTDTSSLLLAALPAGAWLILGVKPSRAGWHAAALAGLGTLLFYSATGPPTIYLAGFWLVLAAYQAWSSRSLLPLFVCLAGITIGAIIALPHLLGVARELGGMRRDGGVGATFTDVYNFFNVRPHEFWRAFDEGIFGRSAAEVAALGNNLNLSEGFQVYSSTFATLAVGALLIRYRGEWFRLFKFRDGVLSLCAWMLVVLSAVVLIKPLVGLLFILFLKAKLIHARLSFIITLPAAILTAVALREWMSADDHASGRWRRILSALLLGGLLWGLLQAIGNRPVEPVRIELWRSVPEIIQAAFSVLLTGQAGLAAAPPLPAGQDPVWLHSGRLAMLLGSGLVFLLLVLARRKAGRHAAFPGYVLLTLVVLQTWREADLRWNGADSHSFPKPFLANNFFVASPGVLGSAQPAAAAALRAQLGAAEFRTVFLPEEGQFSHFVAPHVTSYWRLRTVEGYLSGVPARLAALAWPEDTLGFRTLSFASADQLPWELLAVLNVRQAVVVDTPLYFDVSRPHPTAAPFVGSETLRILANPVAPLPREFFAAQTVPAPDFSRRAHPIELRAESALRSPEVEGLTAVRTWSTEGTIQAEYRGDRVSLELSPSSHARFLVLNEFYHPGWSARAGDRPLPIHPVNVVMRGLEIPPGVTRLELTFRPYSRFPGWWAFPSIGGLLLIALLLRPAWNTGSAPWQRLATRSRQALAQLLKAAYAPRFWRWAAVGAGATGLNLGLLYGLVEGLHVPVAVAPVLSAALSLTLRFLANDRWVFGSPRPTLQRWAKYHVAVAAGFLVWWLTLLLLVWCGLHYLAAAVLAIAGSLLINALGSFRWVWADRPAAGDTRPAPTSSADAAGPDSWTQQPSRWWHQLPKPWVLVLAAYGLLYGILLLATDGYPYVFDNNESYSSLWHARSLYENGVAQTKGLTDEVFSPSPAASPYIHSHQGNFPRLFTFVFYALGLHSIGPQIWVATFTVGLASLWLAFRFLTRLANPTFAALTCLLLMTDYLFFTQWQVGLYNIWHGFFFFSSLTCIQALGEAERRGRWFLLTALNFAALFYWEYVFTAFVVALCGLYALVSYWRRPRLVVMAASAVATGAAVAAGTLLLQLTAYMGWTNVLEDVRLTLTARNAAADPVLLEKVTSFYREHRIIFWHNFMEAAPLRTFQALWDSLYEFHLKYYSPALLYAAVVLGAGWLLGCWSWAQRRWRRVFPLLALAALVLWLWPWAAAAQDPALRAEYALTSGGATLLAAERGLLALVTLVALACAGAGNRTVLGDATGRVAGLLPLLLCGAAAYGLTYRIFTGYIYSGYLHRFVPLPVFLTVPVLGLALSVLFQAGRQAWALASTPTPSPAARLWRRVPGVLVLAAFAGIAAYWAMLQVTYASIIPPDSYAFLKQLERPPFKGHSVVSNTYPAPMAARTGSWGYADPSILSGRITLTPDGFTPERDLKYLWFADRDTNPAYRKPGLAVTVVQRPNFGTALQLQREQAAAPAGRIPLAEASGLAQRTRPLQQAFLHHRMAYSDGDRASVVVLDWDFPPFLRPDLGQFLPAVAGLPLQQKLALSESTQDLRRRWRVVLTPKPTPAASGQVVELREALIDGRPVFSAAELAAAGWLIEPHAGGASWRSDGRTIRPLSALAEGLSLRLVFGGGPHAGQVTVETNDLTDTLDLRARTPVERAFTFTAANPHGRYTYVPALAPGLCVQTILPAPTGHNVAELRYHYAQQDGLAEAGSIVRLYGENPAGRWELADTIIFLGPAGIPVRLAEFQQANPDAVAEHARIAAGGDPRTFAQWLADHLAAHPKEWSRPGIVQPALPPPALTGGDPATVTRRVPLPAGSGRWQFSVSPGTRTKTGTEYFGLPFTLPTARHGPVKFHPPAAATDAPLAFGRLKIRLRFPANPGSGSEPLVTTGGREAVDFLYVQYVDSQHIRIGFDHWFKGGPLSPPIAVDFTQEHELEISLGSLFPAREDVVFASVSAAGVESVKNRVRVILNGQSVLDSAGECYETGPGGVTVGRNAIFGTSCSPEFTGEILSIERSWPDIK